LPTTCHVSGFSNSLGGAGSAPPPRRQSTAVGAAARRHWGRLTVVADVAEDDGIEGMLEQPRPKIQGALRRLANR